MTAKSKKTELRKALTRKLVNVPSEAVKKLSFQVPRKDNFSQIPVGWDATKVPHFFDERRQANARSILSFFRACRSVLLLIAPN